MKKKVLALLVVLALSATLVVPALAATADAPQGGTGTAVSTGSSTVTNSTPDGAIDTVTNGDQNTIGSATIDATAGEGGDIAVWAEIQTAEPKVYSISITWGTMVFHYNEGTKTWNPTTHTYATTTGGNTGWSEDDRVDTNDKITVTNHSNDGVAVAFNYVDGGLFGTASGLATNGKGVAGAVCVSDTAAQEVASIGGNANAYSGLAAIRTAANGTLTRGLEGAAATAPSMVRYFALGGALPTDATGITRDTVTKVGTITVNIQPAT